MNRQEFLDGLDRLFQEQRPGDAAAWLERHHTLAQEEQDLPSLLLVLNEEVGYYRSIGRHEKSCRAFEDACRVMELLGIRKGAAYATTLLNGATAYRAAEDYKKALKLYEEAEKGYQESGIRDTYENAGLYNNMSILYEKLGRKEEAVGYLKKALAIVEQLPDCEGEAATSHTNLGLFYLSLGRKREAMEELNRARTLFESLEGEDAHYGAALGGLAQAYYEAGNYRESITLYEKAIRAVERSFGRNDAFETLCENCAVVCERAGEMEKAERLRAVKSQGAVSVRGLSLSRRYYEECACRLLKERFPEDFRRMTIGLAGHGSECFGFDDELSTDHDFGPSFCIWMDEEDVRRIGPAVQQVYDSLRGSFLGVPARRVTEHGGGRVGVKSTRDFYMEFIGLDREPKSLTEWLRIPEEWLAAAVNGEIFKEGEGSFLRIRKALKGYYPEDVRNKKIAARAAVMAQAGQYNYGRLMMRRDYVGASLAVSEFLKAASSMVYLLNRRYMPYYKWMYKGMENLPILGDVREYMDQLVRLAPQEEAWEGVSVEEYRCGINVKDYRVVYIETICRRVREELKAQGLSSSGDAFLEHHTAEIMSHIRDEGLRALHVMEG